VTVRAGSATFQGYSGIVTVGNKYRVIVDAQAFGEGPVLWEANQALKFEVARIRPLGQVPA
tara:strand:+ start:7196 stop:7378 length:183 start_codon:yes stop_codon:yes gene_type:complete